MPESEFKDLAERPAKIEKPTVAGELKPYYHTLPISAKQIEELGDYELGDEIHLEIVCKVTQMEKKENELKEVTLEIRKGRVLNLTESRKKALERGLSKEKSEEIDRNREKRKLQ